MITKYLEGKHQTKLSQQELKKTALLLKKLHKIKVRQKQNHFKENFTFKNKKVKHAFMVLEKEPKEYALGHNDLHPKNIIFSKNSIKLIDWEYARYSDIYFDLVSIIIEYKLNRKDTRTFLKSYLGKQKINHKKVKAYTLIYKELWRLWFEKLDRGEL
jgi:thiamine kinase-like enzyme